MSVCDCRAKPFKAHCNYCCQDMENYDIYHHVRVMHPDIDEGIKEWPDGTPVAIDPEPTVEDFLG